MCQLVDENIVIKGSLYFPTPGAKVQDLLIQCSR